MFAAAKRSAYSLQQSARFAAAGNRNGRKFRLLQDRICLGTDYPFPLGELQPGRVVEEYAEATLSFKVGQHANFLFVAC